MRLLESKVDCLPDAFRAVFMLRGLEELSVEETAEALGVSPATVKREWTAARAWLNRELGA